ncbi:LptF/LptG family permease [Aureimonas populi]|uniref:LptF/LptG family permease n=1 Tax=Aureimonas populi TaxID=1701758 RepID=A0ABW5CH53_9HYPH|nr:LptF/LptG family permease [Aureimonas populi]
MTLIERYIFGRALLYSLSSLAALVTVVWIVQVLQRIDFVRTSASAAGDIFWIALMLMPDLMAGVLPFAVVIGAVQALNALNADSERAVIAAAGASRMAVANPILLLGLLGGLLVLFNSHVVGPAASSAFQNGLRTINADAISLFLRPGRFETIQDGLVVGIEEARGRQIEGLFLSDTRDPAIDVQYFARQAQIVEQGAQSFLILQNGQLHRRTQSDGAVSVIEFQAYAFDLATLRPMSSGDWVRMSERSTAELLRPDPSDPTLQQNPARFSEEITARRTDWLYPIAFSFWAVVVAGRAQTHRQGTGAAMPIGLGAALIAKGGGFLSLSLISGDVRLAPLAYLVPAGFFAISAVIFHFDVSIVESRPVQGFVRALEAGRNAIGRLLPGYVRGGERA